MHNPLLSIIYSLRLHYYTQGGRIFRMINHLYQHLTNNGKGGIVVRSHTNSQPLFCSFAHQLPFYQKAFPLYDRQLSKLCNYMHNRLNRKINIIDVGANVGDTVLNIGLKDAFYLCIEGNEAFANLIHQNLKHGYSYSLERCYMTDNPTENNYSPFVTNGTNRLLFSNSLGGQFQTLDNLIESKYKDTMFDLIKIDTDGFDFKVIRGAKQSLQKWCPLLFFEWDKAFCAEQREDPLSVFPLLNEIGYKECILFDNFGNPFDKVESSDNQTLKTFIDNTHGERLPFYYDVLAIPEKSVFSMNQLYPLFFETKHTQ